jgi:hypothetical protein
LIREQANYSTSRASLNLANNTNSKLLQTPNSLDPSSRSLFGTSIIGNFALLAILWLSLNQQSWLLLQATHRLLVNNLDRLITALLHSAIVISRQINIPAQLCYPHNTGKQSKNKEVVDIACSAILF